MKTLSQHINESFVNEASKNQQIPTLGDFVYINDKKYIQSAKVTKGTIVELEGTLATIDTTRGKKQIHLDSLQLAEFK